MVDRHSAPLDLVTPLIALVKDAWLFFKNLFYFMYNDQNHGKLLPSCKVSPCGDGHADMGLEGKSVHSSRVDRFDCCQFLLIPEEERVINSSLFIINLSLFIINLSLFIREGVN